MKKLNKMVLAALSVTMLATAGCSASGAIMNEGETEGETLGGWTKAEDGTITPELQEIFDEATGKLIGVSYKAVELVETQVANGTNYRFLAEATTVTPGAEPEQVYILISRNSDGEIDIMNIENINDDTIHWELKNPFVTVDTIEEAAKAAGFSFLIPEEIEGYAEKVISYTDEGMIQAVYNAAKDSITIRKMKSDEDISGDYNFYDSEEVIKIGDMDVTVKSNSDGAHTLIWTNGEYAYSVSSSRGLTMEAVQNLLSSIQ